MHGHLAECPHTGDVKEAGTVLLGRMIIPLVYVLLKSTDGSMSTVSSTGRLAIWWISPEVVLVLEDVTYRVSLKQRDCSERQQANQEKMLHCC